MKIKNILSPVIFCFLLGAAIISCSKSGSAGGTGGTSGGGGTGGITVSVDISGMSFSPSTITIKVGTTVRWTNNDNATHTVTSDNGSTFNSGNIAYGASYAFTPTVTGNFPYHCNIHAGMTGTLIVTN